MRGINYDAIASLDADITFDSEYFSFLLGKLQSDPKLGLVGTPFQDGPNPIYDYRFVNIEHVSGACQLFRRQCFEDIAGYKPVKGGGIDYLAVLSSRMKGWKTRTFTEKISHHHREMGTAQHGILKSRFKYGAKDYAFGNHPIWEVSRTAYQMTQKPMVIGGLTLLAGYIWAFISRANRPVSPELIAFVRKEQMQRLKKFFTRRNAPQSKMVASS